MGEDSVPFPPQTLKDKVRWLLFPWFPRRYLVLYDKDGEIYEFIDDEIRYVVKTQNITVMKCRYNGVSRTAAVLGEDPFVHAQVMSPSELFGRYTMQWTMYFGFIIYSAFMLGVFTNLVMYSWFIFVLLLMMVYFLAVNRMRFHTPSIQYIALHEYGSIEGYPLYVPGPQPQSRLTFSQVSRFTGRLFDPRIKDKVLKELLKETEVAREIIKRLYGVIVRIERQSDRIYDSTYRLASLLGADIIEEFKERLEKEYRRKSRFWMLIALIALVLGLAIGYVAGSTVGVEVSTP